MAISFSAHIKWNIYGYVRICCDPIFLEYIKFIDKIELISN